LILVFGADYATDSTHGILPASPFTISSSVTLRPNRSELEDSTSDVRAEAGGLRAAQMLIRLLQKCQAACSKAIPEPNALNTEPGTSKAS